MKLNRFILFLFSALYLSCNNDSSEESYLFEPVPISESGIDFINTVNENDSFNILEYLYFYNGGGVAIGDINNDGLDDVYLSSNQGCDKLYLNLGNLKFKDISVVAGITHQKGWSTGVNIVDINGDGWKDIYVCRLGNYKIYKDDYNKVYLNNTKGQFIEKSYELGLRFSGFSTQMGFFDMDRDGDLDAYLLNHSIKDPSQFQPAEIRNLHDRLSGDILYENVNGYFKDITDASNIYNSNIGFGLGLSIADYNNDGWQDLYVCNDFHENDYLYINQRNKSFKEVCRESLGHTSRFSMGVDSDYINDDNLIDIFTVDMKPSDEKIFKSSGGWENLQIYNFKNQYGYHHQQPKNAFQLNRGAGVDGIPFFSEIAAVSELDATDWSWSPLIADFDNDGHKDIFITNGINRRPNDLDFVQYISNNHNSQNKSKMSLIKDMPKGEQPNIFFKSIDGLSFSKTSWIRNEATLSNGAATSDLDNDGDFDIVINNYNSVATLLENKSQTKAYKTTTIVLKSDDENKDAIGARVSMFENNKVKNFLIKSIAGFQSSSSRKLLLINNDEFIDSLEILWPNGILQYVYKLKVGETHVVEKGDGRSYVKRPDSNIDNFTNSYKALEHKEDDYNDQVREALMPYLLSSMGPRIAISDQNIGYVTASKNNNGFLFNPSTLEVLNKIDKGFSKSLVDETNACFLDANGDGYQDLYLCLGGNELASGNVEQSDLLYLQDKNHKFTMDTTMLPVMPCNTSIAIQCDYDIDGDIDIFVGVQSKPGEYGNSEKSYFLENLNNKIFKPSYLDLDEMVFDAAWVDFDGNGFKDLVVCGHWMPITIYYNTKGKFTKQIIPESSGLWFSLKVNDVDNDGSMDILAGNFGNNHSYKCNKEEPLMLLINDFDKNGEIESVISYSKEKRRYILPNRDLLISRLPSFKKRFQNNESYAGKKLSEIFTENDINVSKSKYCETTSSMIFYGIKNSKKWKAELLPQELQISCIRAIEGFNSDTYAFGGNLFDIDPSIGRQDALPITFVKYDKNGHRFNASYKNILSPRAQITAIVDYKNKLLISASNSPLYSFRY